MFSVGDKVKYIGNDSGKTMNDWNIGDIGVIIKRDINDDGGNHYTVKKGSGIEYFPYEHNLELITNNKTMTNVKEKFVALFIKEPEKTFRKAGITNGDGFLTEEGQSVFLGYLLNKHGIDFKAEVVDEIVKEEKGDK